MVKRINFFTYKPRKQDPRLQGRAPGFRQGQDRDKTGKRQGQDRRDKSGASHTRKRQGQDEVGGEGGGVKEVGCGGSWVGGR